MKPRIALTMGDPNGIGPEIIVKLLTEQWVRDSCRPLLVGEPDVFAAAASLIQADMEFEAVRVDGTSPAGPIPVLKPEGLAPPSVRWG